MLSFSFVTFSFLDSVYNNMLVYCTCICQFENKLLLLLLLLLSIQQCMGVASWLVRYFKDPSVLAGPV